MKRILIRKITILSVLLAICISISLIDTFISGIIFSSIPGLRLGLANIILLVVLYKYGFKEGLVINILKSIIVGLLFSGLMSFVIGGIASLISYLCMSLIKCLLDKKISKVTVSFIGGITHIVTQLLIVGYIYKVGEAIFAYGVYLILMSIISSILVGIISYQVLKLINIIDKEDLKDE